MKRTSLALLLALPIAGPAAAQTNIAPAHRFSWQENCGWMNWRDAGDPQGALGVRIGESFLTGFIWMENTGWLGVGDGAPGPIYTDCNADGQLNVADFGCFQTRFVQADRFADCNADGQLTSADFGCFQTLFASGPYPGDGYSNSHGGDAGINLLPRGFLEGYAWGENIGWVNFGTGILGSDRARYDTGSRRFRGFAWGENVGWVNLDDAVHYVGRFCRVDCTEDGLLTVADFGCFQARFLLADPYADCNADGVLTVQDFACFQTEFVVGCP